MVEYQGKRVVTLAMIDSVHQRPEGTAKRNFTENRHRFIDGEDFYLIDYSKKNEFHQFGIEIPARGMGGDAQEFIKCIAARDFLLDFLKKSELNDW